MFFVVSREYTSSVTGTAVKEVACEAWGTRYAYRASRTATGNATSLYFLFESQAARQAGERATAAAEKLLARACDPVPCPACGLVQPAMVRAARRERHAWMTNLALGVFAVFCVANVIIVSALYVHGPSTVRAMSRQTVVWASYAAFGGLSFGLWAGRRALAAGYDPNAADRAIRIHEGRTRAIDWVAAGDRRAQERESGWRG